MTVKPIRRVGLLIALVASVVLATLTASAVHAEPQQDSAVEPATAAETNPDVTTLSLEDLGSPRDIGFRFIRNVSTAVVTFAVPPGLNPLSLNATLNVPVNLLTGRLAVSQEDRSLGRLNLPVEDAAPVVIPLAGVQAVSGRVSLRLTMSVIMPPGFFLDTPIGLADSSVTFAGREATPTTVAAFLPTALRRLTVVLPPNPSNAESNAAIQLAAVVAQRYGLRSPEIVVIASNVGAPPPPVPPGGAERTIAIGEGPDAGLSLQTRDGVPALRISGSGDDLANQARLLGDPSLASALGSAATAGPLPFAQTFFDGTTTLSDLIKNNQLVSEGIWPRVGIRVDQTQFGHALRGVRIDLIGSHTPLPDGFGGEVLTSIEGEVIDRWPVEPTGIINRSVSVPNRLLNRSTTIDVGIRTAGSSGGAGDRPTIELRISGDTEIHTSKADPPVPPGFRSLPQTLLPAMQIGIGSDAFGDTIRAIQIIVGLQQASGVPLATTVTTLDEAINSRQPAILIASQGWTSEEIALPVSTDNGRIIVNGVDPSGDAAALGLDSGLPVGSLQTVFDGARTILIATSNGAPGQLDTLLRWLGAKGGRWGGLDGRAVISIPGSDPVTLANPDIDLILGSENTQTRWRWWFSVAGAVVAAAAAGAAFIVVRARRTRST